MEAETHACPVEACKVTGLPYDRLMCFRHWKHVPLSIQKEVWNAWNGLQRGKVAMRDYMAVRLKAISAVEGRINGQR